MQQLHAAYAVLGVAAVALALVSRRLRRLPVSEPLVGLAIGVVLGPEVTGLLRPADPVRDVALLESGRLLLAASVMAAALRFPVRDQRALVRAVVVLLVVVMPVAAAVTGAAALLLGLPLAVAAVVGACLSPTDPVLAASVVSGEPAERALPQRVRALLTAESGANDGLALPLVAVALLAAVPGGEGVAATLGRVAWEVGGGTLIGVALGVVAARGVVWAERREQISEGPQLILTLLLAVAVLGVARLAGTDGILAVFVAGLAYNALAPDTVRGQQDAVDEAVNRYAVLPFFALLGVALPWADWLALGWPALGFATGLLVLRRLPALLALRRPLGLSAREALFAGWFGPMGVSAVFYLAHSMEEGVRDPRFFAVGSLAVAVSVVAFGVTASPAIRWYGAVAGAAPR